MSNLLEILLATYLVVTFFPGLFDGINSPHNELFKWWVNRLNVLGKIIIFIIIFPAFIGSAIGIPLRFFSEYAIVMFRHIGYKKK